MEISERKYKILEAIIRNYLETGEPVGSRTISKYTDLNLSSATIRNEMSDLEELGLILQPHTSAGRIPSDQGYRLYVDHMIESKSREIDEKEKEVDKMRSFLVEKVDKVEELLQNVAKLLASNTNYATMISSPKLRMNKLKFIQLTKVEENKLLTVIVLNQNVIRNRMIELDQSLSDDVVLKMNLMLNTALNGLSLEEMNLSLISALRTQAGEYGNVINTVIDAIAEVIAGEDNLKIYTSGATNIFKYPELSDSTKASELINTLEEKQMLSDFIASSLESEDTEKHGDIQVYIGNENSISTMQDCSVVTATYELGEGMKGAIGIIGPKRMDYEKVLESIKTLKTELDSVYKKSKKDDPSA